MGLCPKCKENSVFYDPYMKMARCCYKKCGFQEKVTSEKSYFEKFEKNSEDYERKIPSYDLSFVLLKQIAVAYRLNGYMENKDAFHFFVSVDQSTGMTAASLEQFVEKIKEISIDSLAFHFYRKDFEKWLTQALGENELARRITDLREQNPVGESLRNQLYTIVSNRVAQKEKKISIA